jgi:two-component system, OmpR family, response regulator
MPQPAVLIVEDDDMMGALLAAFLEKSGYDAVLAPSAAKMAEETGRRTFDAIVLDLGLPDEDGLVLARRLRAASQVPILVLTARQDKDNRIAALELGVDDYLMKPCDPEELVLRVRNLLARSGGAALVAPKRLDLGRFAIDPESRVLRDSDGSEISVTRGEYEVATALAKAPNRVLSRGQLQDVVATFDSDASPRSIDVLIARLRKKLSMTIKDGPIQTVPGVGYRLRR